MEVSIQNIDDEVLKSTVVVDETETKDLIDEIVETEDVIITPIDDKSQSINNIVYDDADDSGDDLNVITQVSGGNYSSPSKTSFSIKTVSNPQTNSFKISKTAIDLDHPGNISGVPTIDFSVNNLTDDCKPWKKPGADVSDFFNYGFTEDTWLHYCEKQKAIRGIQDSSVHKPLSGFTNLPYDLSGSHINVSSTRHNSNIPGDGFINVVGSHQNDDNKNKHNDPRIVNKISTIPVQTGNMNINVNQPGHFMGGFTNHSLNNNLLNPIMSALAFGMMPNPTTMAFLNTGRMDQKNTPLSPIDGNYDWSSNNQNYKRHNNVNLMHSNDDHSDRTSSNIKSDRNNKYSSESRRHRSRNNKDRSPSSRHRSRSHSRDKDRDSKYSRSSRRRRSRERVSSEESKRRHQKSRKSSKSPDKSKDKSHSKAHTSESSKHTHSKNEVVVSDKASSNSSGVKREKET